MGRVLIALMLVAGCSYGEVDLEGKRCPCGGAWVCDPARDVCVRRLGDGGGRDAGGPRDAGDPRDVGPGTDTGGSLDAGSAVDAGPMPDADVILDAGLEDAAVAMDAGPDDTACDDRYAGAIFCDGFEDPGLIAWSGMRILDGTVNRTTAQIWRGSGALHSETTAPGGRALLTVSIPAASTGDLWWRAYVLIPAGYPVETLSLLYIGEQRMPYDGVAFQVVSSERVHAWVGPAAMGFTSAFVSVPRDRWFCAETHVVIDDSEGSVEAYVDGVLSVRQAGIDTHPAADFTELVAGIEWTSPAQMPATVYVDEVVLSTTRPGCD